MRRTILFLAMLASACAYAPSPASLKDAFQIPLYVENNVSQQIIIYATPDGVATRRVGECAGLRTCTFLLDERTSRYAVDKGLLELGFRHFGDPGRGVTSYISTPAWAGMQANLVINFIDQYFSFRPLRTRQVEA